MMLAEINEYEDNEMNRETWYQVKRGFEDRKLTSDQDRHLINHAYFSMGTENHRERCRELMREAETLLFDQLSHYISQYAEQEEPSLKKVNKGITAVLIGDLLVGTGTQVALPEEGVLAETLEPTVRAVTAGEEAQTEREELQAPAAIRRKLHSQSQRE